MDTTGAYIHARATHIHTRPASSTLINKIAHTTQAATCCLLVLLDITVSTCTKVEATQIKHTDRHTHQQVVTAPLRASTPAAMASHTSFARAHASLLLKNFATGNYLQLIIACY
jgi:hypothetical protein